MPVNIIKYSEKLPVSRCLSALPNDFKLRGFGNNLTKQNASNLLKSDEIGITFTKEGLELIGKDEITNAKIAESLKNLKQLPDFKLNIQV